jgi:hypothetical protein
MDIDKAVQKALDELKTQNVFMPHHENMVRQYLCMMYGAGFDLARKIRSHQREVIQMDRFGNVIATHPSAAEASRITKVYKTGIKDCCNGKINQAKGFHWKYNDRKSA